MTETPSSPIAPEEPVLPVATLVIWTLTFATGLVGLAVPYSRPTPPAPKPPPIVAETLQVELTSEPLPNLPLATPALAQPPSLEAPPATPQEPVNLIPVASAEKVAFAVPVEGPTVLVEARHAAYAAPAAPVERRPPIARPVQSAPQRLVYGHGEGRQPAPEYPYRARREGQEGSVIVRFSVGENGSVLAAEAAAPCPWPLLNQAAVNAVRERWRFRPGPVRLYEVSIKFQLQR
jgi:protein TonB